MRVTALLLLSACGGQEVGADAATDGGADACPSCALDGAMRAPDLGGPTYDAWLSDMLASSTQLGPRRYGGCWSDGCGLVAVRFAEGKDCGELYVFDRATRVCVGSQMGCAAGLCVARFGTPSSECPAPKDAGSD